MYSPKLNIYIFETVFYGKWSSSNLEKVKGQGHQKWTLLIYRFGLCSSPTLLCTQLKFVQKRLTTKAIKYENTTKKCQICEITDPPTQRNYRNPSSVTKTRS